MNTISTAESTYHLQHQIGQGGQGVVFLATTHQAEPFAIKLQHFENLSAERQYLEEKKLVQYLQKKKVPICKIKEMLIFKNKGITVMKYYEKDLFSLAIEEQKFSELQVQNIFRNICKGLVKMHKVGVAHLDIKPENFLVNENTGAVDICDFGSSLKANENGEVIVPDPDIRGTKQYMAPEMFHCSEVDGFKCDSFALGVTLFVLLCRRYPFRDNTKVDLKSLDCPVSFECKDLLESLLHPNPKERISTSKALCHPWVQETRKNWLSKFCIRNRKIKSVI